LPDIDLATLTRASALAAVGDIGGTNARFALAGMVDGRLQLFAIRKYLCRAYATVEDALAAYFGELAGQGLAQPLALAIDVAGPVTDGEASLTNAHWTFSSRGLAARFGLKTARVVNDYAALAKAGDTLVEVSAPIGAVADRAEDGTIVVLGAGTGFGVSGFTRAGGVEAILSTEGGHIGFAPATDEQVEILRIFMARHGRVSIERILSGQGLVDLDEALCSLRGKAYSPLTPEQLTEGGCADSERVAALGATFWEIMATVAGDYALAYGARKGVYIAGGVSERLFPGLDHAAFRAAFENKGRFAGYCAAIPTRIILHPERAALLGAARFAFEPLGPADALVG
jgi:glucokinase